MVHSNKKKEFLSIGQLSKICNITVQTLRHYEKTGLIIPAYIDPETKYRYYETDQLYQLSLIRQFKQIGMTLTEINQILISKDFSEIHPIYDQKLKKILENIEKLNLAKEKISSFLALKKSYESILNKFILKEIPKRTIIFTKKTRRFDANENLIHLIELQNIFIEQNLPFNPPFMHIFHCDFPLILTKPVEIELGISLVREMQIKLAYERELNGGFYLTCVMQGQVKNSMEKYQQMLSYISENQYQIIGPVIVIYILPIALAKSPEKVVFEIQIPIIKN